MLTHRLCQRCFHNPIINRLIALVIRTLRRDRGKNYKSQLRHFLCEVLVLDRKIQKAKRFGSSTFASEELSDVKLVKSVFNNNY